MLDLANLGYVGMCLSAFLAATILPFSSEIVLVTLLSTGANEAYLLVAASVGNVLGALVNYVLGWRYGETFVLSWLGIKARTFLRAQQMFKQWGKWSLLLCWVPIIGDPLTLMGGVLRTQFWFFLSVVACTKTLRYGVIVYYFY
ncbi:YqaA family protein [Alteromonas australica]|uniref:YqaA family protein n=1 Tax=Alteromonas australica TaxID=589873 RepID=UPI0035C862A2